MKEQLYKKMFENADASDSRPNQFQAHFGYKAALEQLYIRILKFQAQSVCHFSRHQLLGLGRAIFKIDDWDSFLEDIKSQEAACDRYEAIFSSMRYEENLVARNDGHMQRTLVLLSKLDGFKTEVKEVRDEMRERYFSTDAGLCFEALRTSDYQGAKDRNPHRLAGTCDWLFEHVKFVD